MSNECMSLPPVAVVPVDDAFGEIVNYAVRYALGRRAYAASATAQYVQGLAPHLDERTLRVIEKDIASQRDLGDSCDEEAWLRLLAVVRKELKWRDFKAGDRRA